MVVSVTKSMNQFTERQWRPESVFNGEGSATIILTPLSDTVKLSVRVVNYKQNFSGWLADIFKTFFSCIPKGWYEIKYLHRNNWRTCYHFKISYWYVCVFTFFYRKSFFRLQRCLGHTWGYRSTILCCENYSRYFCQVPSSLFIKMSYFTSRDENRLETKRY